LNRLVTGNQGSDAVKEGKNRYFSVSKGWNATVLPQFVTNPAQIAAHLHWYRKDKNTRGYEWLSPLKTKKNQGRSRPDSRVLLTNLTNSKPGQTKNKTATTWGNTMTNNVIDFAAYKSAKANHEAPAKRYTDNVVSMDDWKLAKGQRSDAAILSTTDVLMSGGNAG